MANDARLKIIIETMNNASKELKELQKDFKGVDEQSKQAEKGTTSFNDKLGSLKNTAMLTVAGIVGVGAALKQVYEIGREGAELDFTASKFDNLTASIDTTSEALMKDLKKAADGTLSDMELMASATDFMSLGLANSHDEVVRLSTVASQLGMNMNQLVLTLTNQTTMRFDSLGMSVAGFDEKVKALEKSGLSASEAFTEAFLQQAEEQIARVGSATEETIGSFMRFEASIKIIGNAIKRDAAPAIGDIVETLSQGINVLAGQSGWNTLLDDSNELLKNGKITYEEYLQAINETLDGMGLMVDEQGNLNITTFEGSVKYMAASKELNLMTLEIIKAGTETQRWQAMADAHNATLGEEATAIDSVTDATNNAEAAMRAYSEALLFKIASEGLSSEKALDLAYAMGLVDEKTVYATERTKEYRQAAEDGLISWETYYALVAGTANALDGMPDDVSVDVWLNIHGYDDFQRVANAISGSISGGPGRANPQMEASGGNVYTGNPYIWQEYSRGGAEAFIPSMDGYILSRSDAAAALASGGKSGGNTTYTLNIYEAGGVVDPVGSIALLEAMAGG